MRYRTLIEITTDAENENEAVDLAGEFLNGNIEDGVVMKCSTRPLRSHIFLKTGLLLSVTLLFIGLLSFGYSKSPGRQFYGIKNISAVQPPLKTARAEEFKAAWKEEESKKVLEYIKK